MLIYLNSESMHSFPNLFTCFGTPGMNHGIILISCNNSYTSPDRSAKNESLEAQLRKIDFISAILSI